MAVGPKFDEWIWIGLIQPLFAEDLKSVGRNGRCIRNNALYDFESVHVSLMFLPAAVPVDRRLGKEHEYRRDQKQCRKAGPVRYSADVPARAEAIENPQRDMKACEKKQQTEQR